jgi:hypothetical protein
VIAEEISNLEKDEKKGKKEHKRKQRDKKVNTHDNMLSGGWRSNKNLGGHILPTYPPSLERFTVHRIIIIRRCPLP